MISAYGRDLAGKVGVRLSTNPIEKLTPNLMNKTNYVVHYHNLQFHLEMSMKLTKIHKVMVFNQSRWLKPYIEFNTVKRQTAKKTRATIKKKLLQSGGFVGALLTAVVSFLGALLKPNR